MKDRALVDALSPEKLHSTVGLNNQHVPYLPVSFQPSISPPPSTLARVVHVKEKEVQPPFEHDEEKGKSKGSGTLLGSQQDLGSDFVFYNEYYLTQQRATDEHQYAGIHPEIQKWLKFGRPNVPKTFQTVRELCQKEGINRVGVCVCGPAPMVNEVFDLCRQSKMEMSCSSVRFDCHLEVFDF